MEIELNDVCVPVSNILLGEGRSFEIAMVKVKVRAPTMALKFLDDAVQAHGGAVVSEDFRFANAWASVRTLRLADGPDEVHSRAIARAEFARYAEHAAPRPQQH
jgi:alkylation response protein AidB-like acyl-CoA dehydrogenase